MVVSPQLCQQLDAEPGIAILLDREGVVRYLNRAWRESAEHDSAAAVVAPDALLGQRYLDFVAGELKHYLADCFTRAAKLGPGFKSIWIHAECNTPRLLRRLTTRISPLWTDGEATPSAYLLHSDVRVIGPLSSRYELAELSLEGLRQENGLILQCGCCRRVRVPSSSVWRMSVELLENPADDVSHGLCPLCLETYYGEPIVSETRPPDPPVGPRTVG